MKKAYSLTLVLFVGVALLSGCDGSSTTGGTVAYPAVMAASSDGNGYAAGLTVVGTGTVEADPDIAHVTLGVDLTGPSPDEIVNDASGRMDRILAALEGAGVAEEDIHTVSYNLWVESKYDPEFGRPTGENDYHVMHTVRVTVRDLDQLGTILAEGVNAGATTISGVSFDVSNPEELATQARQEAIADAQARAQEMAAALGVKLGKVISVSEAGGSSIVYPRAAGGTYESVASVPIPAGEFSATISVILVYELP